MGAGLINAGLVAGAALAAVPIILHLVLRQKPKHLVFPALRLIRLRRRANLKKMRLRQWMLLALRMALIALLALALARPVIQGSSFIRDQEAPVAAVLVFDSSYSMLYQQENKTRLERAQEIGLDLLPKLPDRSEIAVLDSSGSPAVLQADESAVRERIDSLSPTPTSVPVTDLVTEALKALADSPQLRKELYLFSDLAQGSWPSGRGAEIQQLAETIDNLAIYVLNVGAKEPHNIAVASLVPSAQVLPRNSELILRAIIEANGTGGERTVELYLDDGSDHGTPQKRGEENVTLSPGEAREVSFTLRALAGPVHQGYVRIVGGSDPLPFDDQRYFTLEVRPTIRVLLVTSRRKDVLYWEQALAPTEMVRKQRNLYECQVVVSPKEFLAATLDRFAVVTLVNVPELPDQAWVRLREYVIQGGGLAVLAGRRLRPARYNTAPAQDVLPGKLSGDVVFSDPPVYLNPSQFAHPVLAKFRQWEGGDLAQLPVHRYLQIELDRENSSVIMAYNDQRPALVERRVGNGRVLLLTTSVSDPPDSRGWSDLPGAIFFLPLVDQITQYLAGSSGQQLNYEAGQTVTLRLDSGQQLTDYLLITPEGQEPRRSAGPRASTLVVAGTQAVGHYRVQAGPQAGGFQKGFSINAPRDESRLDPIGRNQLDQLLGEGRYAFAEDTSGLERAIGESRVGREVFPILMVLLAGVLAGEQWLANRFYRREDA